MNKSIFYKVSFIYTDFWRWLRCSVFSYVGTNSLEFKKKSSSLSPVQKRQLSVTDESKIYLFLSFCLQHIFADCLQRGPTFLLWALPLEMRQKTWPSTSRSSAESSQSKSHWKELGSTTFFLFPLPLASLSYLQGHVAFPAVWTAEQSFQREWRNGGGEVSKRKRARDQDRGEGRKRETTFSENL